MALPTPTPAAPPTEICFPFPTPAPGVAVVDALLVIEDSKLLLKVVVENEVCEVDDDGDGDDWDDGDDDDNDDDGGSGGDFVVGLVVFDDENPFTESVKVSVLTGVALAGSKMATPPIVAVGGIPL